MKKSSKRIVGIVIVFVLCFLGYNITTKVMHKNAIKENTKTIPSFSAKTMKETLFSSDDLKEGYQTIFVFFNTECEFCEYEVEDIVENYKNHKNTQWVFISTESSRIIQNFVKKKELFKVIEAIFLSDKKGELLMLFDISTFPTTVVYNSNKEFVRKYKGQIKTATILKELN